MSNFYTGGGSGTSNRLIGVSDFLIEVAKGTVLGHSLEFKFGRNPDIDTGSTPEDIWTYGGLYTYNDTPSIQYISSDTLTDLGMEITVQGLDADYNLQTLTVVLNGQNQTQIGTGETFVRVFRAFNSGAIPFTGNILIYDDTNGGVVGGIPTDTTSIKAEIKADDQQTYMAIYTIPAGKTGYFLGGAISLITNASASKSATVDLRLRRFGGVFRSSELVDISSTGTSNFSQDLHALGPLKIPEKTDVLAQVRDVGANDTGVAAYFSILLVDN